jgi:hypothetical protein
MSREKTPVFRRAIVPWYDSDRVCWLVVGFTTATAVFGAVGFFTALEEPAFQNYFWLPLLLLLLSTGVAVSTVVRMFRRYIHRLSR